MPGARLTQQDRRHIAAGLAERLSYSEIAKRLERPTSTITREVMRNGGPNEYRADRAHRTAGRVRRNRPASGGRPAVAAPPSDAYGRNMDAVHDYEQELVQLFMAIGLQQMMSRVLACLCVTDSGSVTAADLTRRLAVSPASVSKAVGQLENQEIIRREREAGHRNDRYIIGDDILFRSIVDNCRRNAALAQTAYKGAGVLGPETPAGVRLTGLGQLLEHVSRGLLQWMEQWPQIRAAQQATHTAGHTDS